MCDRNTGVESCYAVSIQMWQSGDMLFCMAGLEILCVVVWSCFGIVCPLHHFVIIPLSLSLSLFLVHSNQAWTRFVLSAISTRSVACYVAGTVI